MTSEWIAYNCNEKKLFKERCDGIWWITGKRNLNGFIWKYSLKRRYEIIIYTKNKKYVGRIFLKDAK